jgi:glyoxylase-like metal-dependent hydrolase (beta-lactamase superfamily II)
MPNIKRFAIAGLATLSLLLPASIGKAAAAEQASMVTDGIYRYAPGDGYTSMFVVTTDGVIAIEPANTKHAEGMVAAIKSVTDQPIRYLLHSHNHWDHSAGGKAFRDAGAKILAHKEAYDWMKGNPRPDITLPDEGWEGKRKDIILGDTTVEMHYVGMSHGLGMTVFRVAEQKVVYIADIVTPKRVLFSIVPDFNINEWKRALIEVEALDFDTAVFSHPGDENAVGSKADVVENREYIQDLQGAIVAEFKKGKGFTEIPQLVKLPKYESWAMYKEWLPLNTWRVMLDMHMGPFPWRPEPDMSN